MKTVSAVCERQRGIVLKGLSATNDEYERTRARAAVTQIYQRPPSYTEELW